jgi:hypothetical protein
MAISVRRKSSQKDNTLFDSVGNNLTENSQIIKNAVLTSKKIIVPLSKILDYMAVSAITIFAYKMYQTYM